MDLKRVVITGMGALTPVGNSVDEYWENLVAGKSGAGPITKFDASLFKTQFACEVKNFDPLDIMDRKEARKLDHFSIYALATSDEAIIDSGLDLEKVNPANPYEKYKEKELGEYLKNHLELSNKGAYQYSNLGAGLIAYVLSKIENTTYEKVLQDKIFSKYDMQSSTTDITKIKENLIRGLNFEGKETPNWDFSALEGAGAIFSTAEDLSQFAISHFDYSNKELQLTRKKTFEVNRNMDIGLGWHILKSQSKNLWYWHNGATGGYSSSMVIEDNLKNGVIILSNVSAFNPNMGSINRLCFELMKSLEKE